MCFIKSQCHFHLDSAVLIPSGSIYIENYSFWCFNLKDLLRLICNCSRKGSIESSFLILLFIWYFDVDYFWDFIWKLFWILALLAVMGLWHQVWSLLVHLDSCIPSSSFPKEKSECQEAVFLCSILLEEKVGNAGDSVRPHHLLCCPSSLASCHIHKQTDKKGWQNYIYLPSLLWNALLWLSIDHKRNPEIVFVPFHSYHETCCSFITSLVCDFADVS